jgi:hypothetical protein
LRTGGAHEQERVAHAVAARRSPRLQAQPGYGQPQREAESLLAGEVLVRRAGDADGRSSRLQDPERFGERVCALGVQDDVVLVRDRFEVLGSVVDDDVGAELVDPFEVAGAGRRGGRRSQVLGQLDRVRADAPRSRRG